MNVRIYLSHGIKITSNRILGVKRQYFAIFYATLKWGSLRNVTKSVNHEWFIDYIAWRYMTPRCESCDKYYCSMADAFFFDRC